MVKKWKSNGDAILRPWKLPSFQNKHIVRLIWIFPYIPSVLNYGHVSSALRKLTALFFHGNLMDASMIVEHSWFFMVTSSPEDFTCAGNSVDFKLLFKLLRVDSLAAMITRRLEHCTPGCERPGSHETLVLASYEAVTRNKMLLERLLRFGIRGLWTSTTWESVPKERKIVKYSSFEEWKKHMPRI